MKCKINFKSLFVQVAIGTLVGLLLAGLLVAVNVFNFYCVYYGACNG